MTKIAEMTQSKYVHHQAWLTEAAALENTW